MDVVRQAIKLVSKCFNCKEDAVNQGVEPNERTHLLPNPVSNSPTISAQNCDLLRENQNAAPQKNDSNALNRIVQDFASNIIDVAAMDAHNLEPHELNDRIKMYSHKLSQQWSTIQEDASTSQLGLLRDVPSTARDALLSSTPIPEADILMIKNFTLKSYTALNDIKVEHREDLVVPFRIP